MHLPHPQYTPSAKHSSSAPNLCSTTPYLQRSSPPTLITSHAHHLPRSSPPTPIIRSRQETHEKQQRHPLFSLGLFISFISNNGFLALDGNTWFARGIVMRPDGRGKRGSVGAVQVTVQVSVSRQDGVACEKVRTSRDGVEVSRWVSLDVDHHNHRWLLPRSSIVNVDAYSHPIPLFRSLSPSAPSGTSVALVGSRFDGRRRSVVGVEGYLIYWYASSHDSCAFGSDCLCYPAPRRR